MSRYLLIGALALLLALPLRPKILRAEAESPDPDLAPAEDWLWGPEAYYYETLGRRDLFASLVAEPDENLDLIGAPGTGDLQIVGILWGERDCFALAETLDGRSMILRHGTILRDGTVSQVHPDRVVVHVTAYGTSRSVVLPLVQGGSIHGRSRSRSH